MISPIFEIRTARATRGEGGQCRCPLVVVSVAHGAPERRSCARRPDDSVLVYMSPTESLNRGLGPSPNLWGGQGGGGRLNLDLSYLVPCKIGRASHHGRAHSHFHIAAILE